MDYVLDCGFLRFRLQLHVQTLQLDNLVYNNCMWHYYGGTRFERLPPIFSAYKCVWPRGSSQRDVQVLEETVQRVALEN